MVTDLKTMTEQQLREAEVLWPKSMKELQVYIDNLVDRKHDYGTCVYAMSMASVATFHYVASQLGVSGFQASCADMDILARLRHMKMGFRIQDFEHLMYPQTCNDEKFPSWQQEMAKNAEQLSKKAKQFLAEDNEHTHPDVVAHWQMLAGLQS